jgi:hypothetical protein
MVDLAHRVGDRRAGVASRGGNHDIGIHHVEEAAIVVGPRVGAAGNREVHDVNAVDDRVLDTGLDGRTRAGLAWAHLVGAK